MTDELQLTDAESERLNKVLENWLPIWLERVQEPVEIQPGSTLGMDASIYPNGVDIAWISMASAVDHLNAIRGLWLRTSSLHVFADATLLRAALLGAATAVYLLDDSPGVDRSARLRRAGLAALSDHRDHLQHQRAMREMVAMGGPTMVAGHDRLVAKIESWKARADDVAREHGADKNQRRAGLPSTTSIICAGKVVSRGASESDRIRLESGLRAVWQKGSADAHARTWQTKIRLQDAGTIAADLSELILGLNAVALVLNQAWRLWDAQRTDRG